jgi:hypothetical protein
MQQDIAMLVDKHFGTGHHTDWMDVLISSDVGFSKLLTAKLLYSDHVEHFDELRTCSTVYVTIKDARDVEAALRRLLPHYTYTNTVLTVFGCDPARVLWYNRANRPGPIALPELVTRFRDMTKLELDSSTHIVSLPNSLHMLPHLTTLKILFQPVQHINWQTLPHLTNLHLQGTQLTQLPQFDVLPDLQVFYIAGNTFEAQPIPTSLGSCVHLTSVTMYNCNLQGIIPNSILNLTDLQRLDLRENDDIDWPNMPVLEALPKLHRIVVGPLNSGSAPHNQWFDTLTSKGYKCSPTSYGTTFYR